jgi:hypothetical protein
MPITSATAPAAPSSATRRFVWCSGPLGRQRQQGELDLKEPGGGCRGWRRCGHGGSDLERRRRRQPRSRPDAGVHLAGEWHDRRRRRGVVHVGVGPGSGRRYCPGRKKLNSTLPCHANSGYMTIPTLTYHANSGYMTIPTLTYHANSGYMTISTLSLHGTARKHSAAERLMLSPVAGQRDLRHHRAQLDPLGGQEVRGAAL